MGSTSGTTCTFLITLNLAEKESHQKVLEIHWFLSSGLMPDFSLWVGGFCADDVKTTRGDYKQEWLWLVTISTNTVNNFECKSHRHVS